MNKKSIVLYLHVHQPFRVKHYTVFDLGVDHYYFNSNADNDTNNEKIIHKVAEKSYLPTNQRLIKLLSENPDFSLSLSITGTLLEQLEMWHPEALKSFQDLVSTGRVEIISETYYHSLAFFYSRSEFEKQIEQHNEIIKRLFNQVPKVLRNTELAYNNELAKWAEDNGYEGIIAEGWDPILGWRSPNYVYSPINTSNIKLLMKNYKLSDDIAFRFGDHNWSEWPLTADKFSHWLSEDKNATNINLFMDYETFGEHQWDHSGIFEFLEHLPKEWLKTDGHDFKTISQAIKEYEVKDVIDVPYTVTWADTERDLSAWLGNSMQINSINSLYELEDPILKSNNPELIKDWRKLQTSDHFYYMCTKWFNDGDIHAYFSPYSNPYEAYTNFMNSFQDLRLRLLELGFTD